MEIVAFVVLFISTIVFFAMLIGYDERWYIPIFFAIAAGMFLLASAYFKQSCDDFGKLKTFDRTYQCLAIKKGGK